MNDEPIPLRCAWGFHRWTVWGQPEAFQCQIESVVLGKKSDPFIAKYQFRRCLLCNRQDERVAG